MGTLNPCVKRGYITVASLIAIISGLLLAFTLFSHGYFHEDEEIEKILPGIQVMYAASIITILLVTTGLYGLCKRKKWMLICYVVGMTLFCMLLSVLNIQGVAVRPQITEEMKAQYLSLMPLSNATKNVIDGVNEIQAELQCCGLDQGYQDWGYNISESCLCEEDAVNPCVAAPRNSSLFENTKTEDPIMIYKEPCITFLAAHAIFVMNVLLGIILCMLLLWISSIVLCVIILCQLNRKEDTPAVVYSPEAKAGNYSVLSDDVELT